MNDQPPKQAANKGEALPSLGGMAPHSGTQPLNRQRGTRPLMALDALRVELEQTLSKAGRLSTSLENRVELLFHGCCGAGLAVPGVPTMEFKHPITQQGRKIIGYLEKIVIVKPELAKRVQVAIFRFQEAVGVHREAREALRTGAIDETMLEQVKLKFFYLTNYHQEFADDPLLAQMFPTPKGTGTGPMRAGAAGTVMPSEMRKYRQQREIAVRRAESILRLLQPGMEHGKHMLDLVNGEGSRGKSLFDIFSSAQRQERLLAQRLKEDPRCIQILKNAYALYLKMLDITRDVKRGGQFEPLLETIEYMGQLVGIWTSHHLLREFFPNLRKELFSAGGTGGIDPTNPNAPPAQPGGPRGTSMLGEAKPVPRGTGMLSEPKPPPPSRGTGMLAPPTPPEGQGQRARGTGRLDGG